MNLFKLYKQVSSLATTTSLKIACMKEAVYATRMTDTEYEAVRHRYLDLLRTEARLLKLKRRVGDRMVAQL